MTEQSKTELTGYREASAEEMTGPDVVMIGGRPHVHDAPKTGAAPRLEFRGFYTPESSNIVRVVWFPEPDTGRIEDTVWTVRGKLAVEFKGGATYAYKGVSSTIYHALLAAPSVGATFDKLVKKAGFAYEKLTT